MNFAPQPKGRTRRQVKGREDRHEAAVKAVVRAVVKERDNECRVATAIWGISPFNDVITTGVFVFTCLGRDEWAHMHNRRRSQTRGEAPEKRHTTAGTLLLCKRHHQEYDAHRLKITCLTRKGADGPLKFRRVG